MDSPRTPSRQPTRGQQRRSSVQSGEGTIHEEDTESDASEMAETSVQSHRKNLTGKTIDPIQLLDKKDFEGRKYFLTVKLLTSLEYVFIYSISWHIHKLTIFIISYLTKFCL